MSDYISQIFDAGGLLEQQLEGYEVRPGQIQLARAIDQAMCDGGHCLAEGPCGTGKSMAYGIPAIAHAASNGIKTVIATANINLQEQLFFKDLPFLKSVLPWNFKFALLKGRNNYYCSEKEFASHAAGTLKRLPQKLQGQMNKILNWAQQTKDGDKSELPFDPDPQVWNKVAVTGEDCKGEACSYRDVCFFERAKKEAMRAQIVVTNYHMLFGHISVRKTTGGANLVLPRYDFLILDEGHEMAEIARDFFGFSLSFFGIRDMARWCKTVGQQQLEGKLLKTGREFFDMVRVVGSSKSYRIRLRAAGWDKGKHRAICALLGELQDAAKAWRDSDYGEQERKEAGHTHKMASKFRVRLKEACGLSDPNKAYWIDVSRAGNAMIKAKPVNVAEQLKEEIWDATRTVILTSATLTTGGNFKFLRGETGVPTNVKEIVADSPFDYAKQCLFVVPNTMPPPKDPGFPGAVADAMGEIIEACRGRALCLFTSKKNMREVHSLLLLSTATRPYKLLLQGDGLGRAELYKKFKDDVESCLFGVASFWTGVDVPGEALTALVIDKLPFPNMSDPLVNAISERDKKSFWNYSVPKAIITLRQGIGRLIRRKDDYGVVAVLDSRLLGGSKYGGQFLSSLPPMRATADINDVRMFIEHMEG